MNSRGHDNDTKRAPGTQRVTLGLAKGVVQRPKPLRDPEAWLLWADGRRPGRIKHPTLAAALAEADRLAALNPGRRFDVYALVPVARRVKPHLTLEHL
jgi:hypothetical protein